MSEREKRAASESDRRRAAAWQEEAAALRRDALDWVTQGAARQDLAAILREAMRGAVDEALEAERPRLQRELSERVIAGVRDAVAQRLAEELRRELADRWHQEMRALVRQALDEAVRTRLSPAEMTRLVRAALRDAAVESRDPDRPHAARAPRDDTGEAPRRPPWLLFGLAAGLLVLLGAGGWMVTRREPPPLPAPISGRPVVPAPAARAATPPRPRSLREAWLAAVSEHAPAHAEALARRYDCWFAEIFATTLERVEPAKVASLRPQAAQVAAGCGDGRVEKAAPNAAVRAAQVAVAAASRQDPALSRCFEQQHLPAPALGTMDGIPGTQTYRILTGLARCRQAALVFSPQSSGGDYVLAVHLALRGLAAPSS